MKKYKTYSTNPELCIVGTKCHVSIPSYWIGAYEAQERGEHEVWLPAKIIEVNWGKDDYFKQKYGIPSITCKVRASHKYKTASMESLLCLPTQVNDCIRFR